MKRVDFLLTALLLLVLVSVGYSDQSFMFSRFAALVNGGENALKNADFQDGLAGWKRNSAVAQYTEFHQDTTSGASIAVGEDDEVAFPYLYQEFSVESGQILKGGALVRGDSIRDGYGVYLSVEFYTVTKQRIGYRQTSSVSSSTNWQELILRCVVPDEVVAVRFCLILNGRGTAYFDKAVFCIEEGVSEVEPNRPVTIKVTQDMVCESFYGFGIEDDGWFYNRENAAQGVDERDIALKEERLRFMQPDWVRMFFWHLDWNPSGDWKTFDFTTDNMQSHYRTLELYQKLDAKVVVCGVEWGMKNAYRNPREVVNAVARLLEFLIIEKGFTCIAGWTLTNEPNTTFLQGGHRFSEYVTIHTLMNEELRQRNLPVAIIGSDDAMGYPWFEQCVNEPEYNRVSDVMASHAYMKGDDRIFASTFFTERLQLLEKAAPSKPLIVAEFGFQDDRSTHLLNPVMKTYDYALWTYAFCLEGMNLGVAGFSMWCLHEMVYPMGSFMRYGLWDYRDRGWAVRPVYHAWSHLCRISRRGAKVYRCDSHDPSFFMVRLGDVLLWVNQSQYEREVRIEGVAVSENSIFSEAAMKNEDDAWVKREVDQNRIVVPGRSFGSMTCISPDVD